MVLGCLVRNLTKCGGETFVEPHPMMRLDDAKVFVRTLGSTERHGVTEQDTKGLKPLYHKAVPLRISYTLTHLTKNYE